MMPVVYMLVPLGIYVVYMLVPLGLLFGLMLGFWSLFALILRRFRLPFPTPAVVAVAVVTTLALAWLLLPFVLR